jgi:hypothetical protein
VCVECMPYTIPPSCRLKRHKLAAATRFSLARSNT